MTDTDAFSDLEILACTLLGESEDLGEQGMTGTALTIVNRAAADLDWLGGTTLRGVCLQKSQYDCWWPQDNNDDRQRILLIASTNPLYGPYVVAQGVAKEALSGILTDFTHGAVSYYDPPAFPFWAKGKTPCYVEGARNYFNLAAIR